MPPLFNPRGAKQNSDQQNPVIAELLPLFPLLSSAARFMPSLAIISAELTNYEGKNKTELVIDNSFPAGLETPEEL